MCQQGEAEIKDYRVREHWIMRQSREAGETNEIIEACRDPMKKAAMLQIARSDGQQTR